MIAVGQALGKLANAAGPLLNALSPEQKDRLPVLIRGIGPRRAMAEAFGIEAPMGGDRPWQRRFQEERRFDLFRDSGRDARRYGGWDGDRRPGRFGPDDERFGGGGGEEMPFGRFRHGWGEDGNAGTED